jgi:hypothetical protein
VENAETQKEYDVEGEVDALVDRITGELATDEVEGVATKRAERSITHNVARPAVSGPWSLEWLHGQKHGGAGILFSPSQRNKKCHVQSLGHTKGSTRKKVGGVLRHTLKNLKKVARLPGQDRREVLKILQKEVKKRGRRKPKTSVEVVHEGKSDFDSSQSSVNKDWEHWVVMHGDEEVVREDVRGLGEAIGIQISGDGGNMFRVSSRGGERRYEAKRVDGGSGWGGVG